MGGSVDLEVRGGSARRVGFALLLVPVVVAAAGSSFPSYDARSAYYAQSFPNIVDAGAGYLVALGLFLVVAGLLVGLAVAFVRSPLRDDAPALPLVGSGLAASAAGFAIAGLAGIPVWMAARQVVEGSETAAAMAARSEGLAVTSQTLLLMLGFGGLLVAMSALGVIAAARGWTPKWALWGTIAAAVIVVGIGSVTSGPVVWLALGVLPMLWALVFGAVLVARGSFRTESA